MTTPPASTFPDGFLWGAATAAHQVEGGNANNDGWFLEHLPGTIFTEPSGDAIDHYHRFADDIALLAGLGLNTYRLSLEWSRIEPAEGEFSTAALEHYRRVLATCHEHGLTPVVTYHHFTSPRWLLARGGWEDEGTPARFARYCERATRHLGDLVGMACTLNEPNLPDLLATFGIGGQPRELRAKFPMWAAAADALGVEADRIAPFQFTSSPEAFDTKLAAHRTAIEAIGSGPGEFPIGWTLANTDVQAGPGGEELAATVRRDVNERFLEASRGNDFVGVQTYGRTVYGPDGVLPAPEGAVVNQMGEEFYPQALEATVRQAAAIAQVPVVVTENGLATADDTQRIAYVDAALSGVAACLRDGIDVRGYVHWTAFDNFEWIFGYRPTFGLIAVDRTTQQRTPKPSAHHLGRIARANGATVTS